MELLNTCLFSFGLLCTAADASALTEAAAKPAATEAPAKKLKASALLARVQAFYDGTTDMQAAFKQTYRHQVYGTKTVTKGQLSLKKPGRMVWDYEGKADPDFYVTDETLWVVEHDTRQVVSQNVSNNSSLSGAMKFLFGGQKLIQDFWVRNASQKLHKRFGIPGHQAIELKPKKKNPHFKTLLLIVDKSSGRVDSFVIRNQDNSINHFVLTDIKLNVGLGDEAFAYKVPSGYVETKQ